MYYTALHFSFLVQTHGYVVEGDAGDVVVGAALPGVVEPEAESAGVSSLERDILAERAVLHVDGPVIYLHSSYGEVTAYTHFVFPVEKVLVPKLQRRNFLTSNRTYMPRGSVLPLRS